MKVIPVTQARKNIYKLIDETIESSVPVEITTKKGNAILLSERDWSAIQETLYLVSIPGMRESIIEGLNTPIEECEALDWENIE
ncbi:MAG: type II toxin-antitoxin system Phd/YefM family antitoxin [Clostridia bacterium]|nr:type II toxin-antitoxin system Phd/YefM family antitoxin [Clostridia bacterium]